MHHEAPIACVSRDSAPAVVQESELVERIAELDAVVGFLQSDVEQKSASVARKLHDEIGGAMIGAMMDVAWVEQHDAKLSSDTAMRLARIKDGLRGAVDLARTMVEELRPTLLDSVGLFAALSWQFRRGCARAGINYRETYPESAPDMETDRLIALFRIAQEAFNLALQQDAVSNVSLSVNSAGDNLMVQLEDNRRQSSIDAGPDSVSTPMSAIFHRVKQLRGEAAITARAGGGSVFRVTVPLH